MDEIKFPVICVVDGRIEIFANSDIIFTTTVLSYKMGNIKDIPIYDSEGKLFKSIEAIPCRKIHFIEKVFSFLWSPFILVKLKFRKTKTKIDVSKLKSKIKRIIKRDDDIYCQFIDKEDIFKIIDATKSVKELIIGVKKILEPEESMKRPNND